MPNISTPNALEEFFLHKHPTTVKGTSGLRESLVREFLVRARASS
jgi:hypothetical protein